MDPRLQPGLSIALIMRLLRWPGFIPVVIVAIAIVVQQPCIGVAIAAVILLLLRFRRRPPEESDTHGSARFAHPEELRDAGMLDATKGGLVLCRMPDIPSARLAGTARSPPLITVNRYTHVLVCAGTGAGKGIGFVVPNLLTQEVSSIIVFDLKADLASLTAKLREQRYGPVHLFDPWGLVPDRQSECFNPLDFLGDPESDEFLDNCRVLADAIVVRQPQEKDPHFSDMSVSVLTAMIAFICVIAKPEVRNLNGVKALLAGKHRFQAALKRMAVTHACQGILPLLAAELNCAGEKEMGSILTTVSRHLAAFTSPVVARHLSRSTFDYLQLVEGEKPRTLYWVMPANRLESHKGVARLWIFSLLLRLMQQPPSEKRCVVVMLDEVAQLGQLQPLETALTLARGWGLRIILIVQSLQQLERVFPDGANTAIANTNVQLYFGIREIESAEMISKRIGQMTIDSGSYQGGTNDNSGATYGNEVSQNTSLGWSESMTYAEQGRDLLQPAEITRLPNDVCIAFTEEVGFPIAGQRLAYFREPEFKHLLSGEEPSSSPSTNEPASTPPAHRSRLLVVLVIVVLLFAGWFLWQYAWKPTALSPPADGNERSLPSRYY